MNSIVNDVVQRCWNLSTWLSTICNSFDCSTTLLTMLFTGCSTDCSLLFETTCINMIFIEWTYSTKPSSNISKFPPGGTAPAYRHIFRNFDALPGLLASRRDRSTADQGVGADICMNIDSCSWNPVHANGTAQRVVSWRILDRWHNFQLKITIFGAAQNHSLADCGPHATRRVEFYLIQREKFLA